MSNFITTEQIFEKAWSTDYTVGEFEPSPQWHYVRPITLDEITLWEEIFYQPGHIGIYGSYQPYAEFYIIVYDLFKSNRNTIETFYGKNASEDVRVRATELGVNLKNNPLYVDPLNVWMYN
jgi:hypothetical protein